MLFVTRLNDLFLLNCFFSLSFMSSASHSPFRSNHCLSFFAFSSKRVAENSAEFYVLLKSN